MSKYPQNLNPCIKEKMVLHGISVKSEDDPFFSVEPYVLLYSFFQTNADLAQPQHAFPPGDALLASYWRSLGKVPQQLEGARATYKLLSEPLRTDAKKAIGVACAWDKSSDANKSLIKLHQEMLKALRAGNLNILPSIMKSQFNLFGWSEKMAHYFLDVREKILAEKVLEIVRVDKPSLVALGVAHLAPGSVFVQELNRAGIILTKIESKP
jgi:hypothetical protein